MQIRLIGKTFVIAQMHNEAKVINDYADGQ